ncbi:ThuA domain-containing protein [Aestuariivivens sediminicola]|uniref:ThuA domain-containing protein n=1 Tax=Aestuariivivens sediminicola TaxID=2913560 RepID=UPI001F58B56B|nr:ThuA domain-containing protein [Aestuariivivens sediminicola]
MRHLFFVRSVLIFSVILFITSCSTREKKILVFSKTVEHRHTSIESGIKALKQLGLSNDIAVVATEDDAYFVEDSLKQYAAIVFLNTTGDILNAVQQADFERYIQAGGGFVGIHSATDTEYDWPWYGKLVGAYFVNHPAIQKGTLNIIDKTHPSTSFLNDTWEIEEEWYNYKNINPDTNVLIEIDENSYEGGLHGDHHPISWYHSFDGGRAFYTELGHRKETYSDPIFLKHVLGGIQYAIGKNRLDYTKATSDRVPPENRFVKTVLDLNLNEPMELDELPGEGILFVERRGAIKLYDFKSLQTKTIAQIDLFYGNEDGLLGLAVDPNYLENHWIYLFYSAPGDAPLQHISRFDLKDGTLDLESEKILLKVPTIRECCHSGGALEFGPNGNLFITLGDNTNPFESSGFAPIDEREGRALWDAQKSASNSNDLRGKILRIKPEDDGTYSIPEGNLFPEGTPDTRPEIYAMGCRNPFRPSVDSKTGYLYWGDVGPDAGTGDPTRGPKGMGEINQARSAGFWGWPYTRGNNQVYNDYDFAMGTSGPKFDPEQLVNDSPNNTGIEMLPAAKASLIWYSYDRSEEFPWLGLGGVNPMAGPIFHADDFPNAETTFPSYFENKLIMYEWMRDWIYVVTLDANYNYIKAEPFMPSTEFSHPMDMIFASDGHLYLLEYGQKWNSQNLDARLSRISYIEGNRKPIARIENDINVGSAPLTVQFSAAQSIDYDNDKLTYEWTFNSDTVQSTAVNPSFTFERSGTYNITLKATDTQGEISTSETKILVGNDPPEIAIAIAPSDSIYWNTKKVTYNVIVRDAQDGSTADGSLDARKVKVTLTYIPEGSDLIKATIGHQQSTVPKGRQLIDGSDCKACHATNVKVNGPSYEDIAKKYDKDDIGYLVSKVIKGGTGVWGESLMSAHPQLTSEETEQMVRYILSLKPEHTKAPAMLPLNGVLEFKEHLNEDDQGRYVLLASYLDNGGEGIPDSRLAAQEQIIFYAPKIQAEDANKKSEGLGQWNANGEALIGSIVDGSYLAFNSVRFKGLKSIRLSVFFSNNYDYEGEVELREGQVTGPIIGKTRLNYFNKDKGALKYYDIPVHSKSEQNDLILLFKNEKNKAQYIANANWILLNY